MRTVPILVSSLISTAIAASLGTSARAQDALGTGNALDANLSTTGKGNAMGSRIDYRARNAVITNNVAGGRGFRGSVGYSADNDFRGALGSNDLYNFRAESALSSPDLFSLGSTYQQLRFGQGMGVVEYDRSGAGAPPMSISPSAVSTETRSSLAPRRIGANDDFNLSQLQQIQNLDRSSLASTSAFTLQNAAEPRVVGMTYAPDNSPVVYTASNLRGVTAERANGDANLIGLTSLDEAKLRADFEQGRKPGMIGTPFQTRFEQASTGSTAEDTRIKPPSKDGYGNTSDETAGDEKDKPASNKGSSYDTIMQSVRDRYKTLSTGQLTNGDQPNASQLEKDYRELRTQLSQGAIRSVNTQQESAKPDSSKPEQPKPKPIDDPTARPDSEQSPAGIRTTPHPGMAIDDPARGGPATGANRLPTDPTAPPQPRDPDDPEAPGDPSAPDASKPSPLSLDQYGVILRHGQKVETLSSENQNRFNELMSSAEEKLRQGEYFWAERRFDRALRFTPGHPLATAGAGHAQLGAGLYLSSALTLHNLFTTQPEMIDVRYADTLLPKRERITESIRMLRTKIDEDQSAESANDRASFAFVLAYLGHQTSDQAMVDEGLEAMSKYSPNDKLLPLLKTVWQGGEAGK